METLTPFFLVIESSVKNSREARNALRAWLDELDRDFPLPEPKPATAYLPTITVVKPRVKWLKGMNPYFEEDPEAFKWKFTGGNDGNNVAYFETALYDGELVKMNYFYTTGTVQLVHMNPDREDYINVYGHAPYGVPRRVQETYRNLDDVDFINLLDEPRAWFGRGIKS